MKSNLHNVLKELRAERGITQQEVANSLGISQKTYCNYENGNREPNIDTLISLSNYFRVPIDFLVGLYVRREE